MKEMLADVIWMGRAKQDILAFPVEIRKSFGFSIYEMQRGAKPSKPSRPMPSIDSGVFELKEQDERAWYRVVYYTRIQGKVVVLHCFEKDTRKTEQKDIETARKRLKQLKGTRPER